jgi:hypothetical protein
MTGPIEDYLRELQKNLRTPPEETSRILAEAEDHLAESVADNAAVLDFVASLPPGKRQPWP